MVKQITISPSTNLKLKKTFVQSLIYSKTYATVAVKNNEIALGLFGCCIQHPALSQCSFEAPSKRNFGFAIPL